MSDYRLVLEHHGILGQKWGVRRFQDTAGRLTAAGKSRYGRAKSTLEYVTRDTGWGNKSDNSRGSITPWVKNTKLEYAKYKTTSNVDAFSGLARQLAGVSKTTMNSYVNSGRSAVRQVMRDAEHLTRDAGWQRKGETVPKYSNREYLALRTMDKGGIDFTNRYYRLNPKVVGSRPNFVGKMKESAYDQYRKHGFSDRDATLAAFGNETIKRYYRGYYNNWDGRSDDTRANPYWR